MGQNPWAISNFHDNSSLLFGPMTSGFSKIVFDIVNDTRSVISVGVICAPYDSNNLIFSTELWTYANIRGFCFFQPPPLLTSAPLSRSNFTSDGCTCIFEHAVPSGVHILSSNMLISIPSSISSETNMVSPMWTAVGSKVASDKSALACKSSFVICTGGKFDVFTRLPCQ